MGGVALAALPEAHDPFSHDLALSGEGAIAADNVIHIVALDEIVVLLATDLTPHGEFVLLLIGNWSEGTESAVALAAIGFPIDVELNLLTLFEVELELTGIRIPRRTPDLGEKLFAVYEDAGVACIVDEEAISTGLLWLKVAVEIDIGTIEREALGEVLLICEEVGEIEDGLGAVERLNIGAWSGSPMAGETALDIVLVVDLESLIELSVFTLVAPTGEGVVVPKIASSSPGIHF